MHFMHCKHCMDCTVLLISIYDDSSGDHHASVQCPSPQVSAGASYAHWPGWGYWWSVACHDDISLHCMCPDLCMSVEFVIAAIKHLPGQQPGGKLT